MRTSGVDPARLNDTAVMIWAPAGGANMIIGMLRVIVGFVVRLPGGRARHGAVRLYAARAGDRACRRSRVGSRPAGAGSGNAQRRVRRAVRPDRGRLRRVAEDRQLALLRAGRHRHRRPSASWRNSGPRRGQGEGQHRQQLCGDGFHRHGLCRRRRLLAVRGPLCVRAGDGQRASPWRSSPPPRPEPSPGRPEGPSARVATWRAAK